MAQCTQNSTNNNSNAGKPANCYSIGRAGDPKEGIQISLNKGPDALRPWEPHVLVGTYRLDRDRFGGCMFQTADDGKNATVRRATVKWHTPNGKRPFSTLVVPEADKPGVVLSRVSATLPLVKGPVMLNGRELRLFAGVSTTGNIVARDGREYLVELGEGHRMTVFYPDGGVRTFRKEGLKLFEHSLSPSEMLEERIMEAWTQLDLEDARKEVRENVLSAILSGMADLLHITTRFNGNGMGQEFRLKLVREFFLNLTPQHLTRVHKKVVAILHAIDPALVELMFTKPEDTAGPLPHGVANISTERDKRDRAKRDAAREARRQERLAAQPKKGAGGSKQKQTTNPKKVAKLERKLVQRKRA